MVDFWVGQKVVCVNAKPASFMVNLGPLAEGETYTVREIYAYTPAEEARLAREGKVGGAYLRLQEIRRPIDARIGTEPGYQAKRFRPLVQTDISVFTAMLAPQPELPEKVE